MWADNPKAAPPAWTNLFSGEGGPSGADRDRAELGADRRRGPDPDLLAALRLPAGRAAELPVVRPGQVTYHARPPSMSVVLVRPDGQEVALLRDVVRGPRPGEPRPTCATPTPLPGAAQRRVRRGKRPPRCSPRLRGAVDPADLEGHPEQALFGVPDGSGGFTPLHGDYRVEARIAVADPTDRSARWASWSAAASLA